MPEWSNGAVSKTVVRFAYPGFESLSLRHLVSEQSKFCRLSEASGLNPGVPRALARPCFSTRTEERDG